MQAESQALSDFTKETVFVRWLLQELIFFYPAARHAFL
jgi:hypothetical protein